MATAAKTYTFTPSTTIVAAQVNTNFDDVVDFLNQEVVHKDASVAFTGVPSGPATDPSTANQFTRKQYVDNLHGRDTYASLYRTGAVALGGTGSNTTLIFENEVADYGNNYNTATGNYACPTAGTYQVVARTSIATGAAAGERFSLALFKNGVFVARGMDQEVNSASSPMGLVLACSVPCNAADVLQVRVEVISVLAVGRALEVGAGISYAQISRQYL